MSATTKTLSPPRAATRRRAAVQMRCRFPQPVAAPTRTTQEVSIMVTRPRKPATKPATRTQAATRAMPLRMPLRTGAALAVGTLLAGCAGLSPQSMPPAASKAFQVEPMLRIETAPLSAESAYQLGKQALADGRNETALAWFDRAMAMQPKWVDAFNGRAVALSRLGRTDEAVAALRGAIELQPNAAHLHGNLSMLLIRGGQFETARVHVEQAIRLAPQDTQVWPGVRDQLAQLVAAAKIQAERAAPVPAVAQAEPAAKPIVAAVAPAVAATLLPAAAPVPAQAAVAIPAPVAVPMPAAVAMPLLAQAVVPAAMPVPVQAVVPAVLPAPVQAVVPAALPMPASVPVQVAAAKAPPETAPAQGMRWVQQSPHILELKAPDVPAVAVTLPAPRAVARVLPREVPVAQAAESSEASRPAATTAEAVAKPAAAPVAAMMPVTSIVTLAQMVVPPVVALPAAGEGLARLKVEFSNGAGREGLARFTAGQVSAANGIGAVRLTNHRHYNVMRTEVQYRSEQDRAAAATLAKALGLSVALVHQPGLMQGVGIRVLLGRDAAKQAGPILAVRQQPAGGVAVKQRVGASKS